MSSQLTSPAVHQPEPPEKPDKPKIDLSASQVLGGALAAMTAAALGSRLGVAGTVIGAAVASVVAAVGGSVYTASIRASRERVKTVLVRRPDGRTDAAAAPSTDALPITGPATDLPLAPSPGATKRAWSWKTALVGAFAAFALAAVALTGFEVFTGNALSGGSGTTITQVANDTTGSGTRTQEPTVEPSASSDASASASADPSGTPSTEATPSASASPSASESTPTEPTPSASASSEPTPSASATPSTGTDGG